MNTSPDLSSHPGYTHKPENSKTNTLVSWIYSDAFSVSFLIISMAFSTVFLKEIGFTALMIGFYSFTLGAALLATSEREGRDKLSIVLSILAGIFLYWYYFLD